MNFKEAKAKKKELDDKVSQFGEVLRSYPKNEMGMTPDDVKSSEAYRLAKSNFDKAFKALREFNQSYVKTFKSEIMADRTAKMTCGTCHKLPHLCTAECM